MLFNDPRERYDVIEFAEGLKPRVIARSVAVHRARVVQLQGAQAGRRMEVVLHDRCATAT